MLNLSPLKKVIKKTSICLLTAAMIAPTLGYSFGEEYTSNHPINRFGFNIDNGLDLYISPNFIGKLTRNLDTMLGKLEVSSEQLDLQDYELDTGVQSLEKIVTNQELLRSIISIRSQFRYFFSGLTIRNNHHFEMKAKGIELNAKWSRLGVQIAANVGQPNKITAIFVAEAQQLGLNVNSLRIQDHQHDFIGVVGGDQFYVQLDEKLSEPLKVFIPVELEMEPGDHQLKIDVKGIESNVGQIKLKAGWDAPLLLPSVKVTVNNRSSYMKASEVERTLKRELKNILHGMQQELEDYLYNEAPLLLEDKLENISKDNFKTPIEIPLLFATEWDKENPGTKNYPNSAALGFKLNQVGMRYGHMRIQMNAFLEDGKNDSQILLGSHKKARAEVQSKFLDGINYDVAAAINIEVINKYIELSCRRGYLNTLNLGNETIELATCPYAKVDENNNELRLVANVTKNIDAWFFQATYYAVNDPIVVRFEVGLKTFVTNTGGLGLKLSQIYPETAFIAPQYINFASESVHQTARDELNGLNGEFKEMIIIDELDIPRTYKGVSLDFKRSKVGKNGNIIFYLKSNL